MKEEHNLSEMIKACEGHLLNLSRCTKEGSHWSGYNGTFSLQEPEKLSYWLASGYTEKYINHNTPFAHFIAPTPEEAVTKFWLALNKK